MEDIKNQIQSCGNFRAMMDLVASLRGLSNYLTEIEPLVAFRLGELADDINMLFAHAAFLNNPAGNVNSLVRGYVNERALSPLEYYALLQIVNRDAHDCAETMRCIEGGNKSPFPFTNPLLELALGLSELLGPCALIDLMGVIIYLPPQKH